MPKEISYICNRCGVKEKGINLLGSYEMPKGFISLKLKLSNFISINSNDAVLIEMGGDDEDKFYLCPNCAEKFDSFMGEVKD